jgi:hypothetical protein
MVGNTAANNTAADNNHLRLAGNFSGHYNLLFVLLYSVVPRKKFINTVLF